MTERQLSNLLQNLPELTPDVSLWQKVRERISPRPKAPSPWLSAAFATAVMVVAAIPMFTHQTADRLPESIVTLAELVEETEQMKQEVLYVNVYERESLPSEQSLINRVDSLDQQVYGNPTLAVEERQRLLERQRATLESLRYLQRQNSTNSSLVRRVSY